jgi:hypothetical protein
MVFLTTGQIAEEVGANRDMVSYAIRRAAIEPAGRAGIVRLFTPEAVGKVRAFLGRKRQPRDSHDS